MLEMIQQGEYVDKYESINGQDIVIKIWSIQIIYFLLK
jgi:hypothetical protein